MCNKIHCAGLRIFTKKTSRLQEAHTYVNMLISGALNLPFLIFGTAFGSIIVKKWKFGKLEAIKMVLFSSICGVILYVPGLFLGCDTIETVGINQPYPGR